MSEEMLKCQTISSIICACYNKLIRLSIANKEDSKEFQETIAKLKKIIPIEIEQYKKLNDNELNTWYEYLSNMESKPQIEDRIHNRLNEMVQKRSGAIVHNDILLSTAITGKIMIDVFKDLKENIVEIFFNEEVNKDEFNIMLNLLKTFKYNYLSVSNYLELICLKHNYNLEDIKPISFKDIENTFQHEFVNNSKNIFFNYVVESIKEIKEMNYDNEYLTGFLSMFELSRITVMLKYLDRESLDLLSNFYNNERFNYQDNKALVKVKSLIDDRKRELR